MRADDQPEEDNHAQTTAKLCCLKPCVSTRAKIFGALSNCWRKFDGSGRPKTPENAPKGHVGARSQLKTVASSGMFQKHDSIIVQLSR
jgi:hypothetical protein